MSKQSKRHMGANIKSAEGVDAITVADDGKVGIGTDSPTEKLTIKTTNLGEVSFLHAADLGTVNGRYYSLTAPTTDNANAPFVWGTGNAHAWEVDNIECMRVDSNGLAILGGNTASGYSKLRGGANTPAFAWRNNINESYSSFIVQRSQAAAGSQIYQIFEAGATDIGVGGSTVGGIRRNSGNTAFEFYNPSDERLKNVKNEFSAALEKVEGIPVKWYSWKTSPDQEHFRFIAQDVQKHIPSAVFEDEEGHLQLGESDMFPVLWQAVRELKAELDEAKAEIAALRKQP